MYNSQQLLARRHNGVICFKEWDFNQEAIGSVLSILKNKFNRVVFNNCRGNHFNDAIAKAVLVSTQNQQEPTKILLSFSNNRGLEDPNIFESQLLPRPDSFSIAFHEWNFNRDDSGAVLSILRHKFESVSFDNCRGEHFDSVIARTVFSNNAEELELENCDLHGIGGWALGCLKTNTSLKELTLGCGMARSDALIMALGDSLCNNTTLQRLTIEHSVGFDGEVIQRLANGLRENSGLVSLRIGEMAMELPDEHVALIANALAGHSTLQDLTIVDFKFGVLGPQALATFVRSSTSLKFLRLNNCRNANCASFDLTSLATSVASSASLRSLIIDESFLSDEHVQERVRVDAGFGAE
jgi:hypothetical protein